MFTTGQRGSAGALKPLMAPAACCSAWQLEGDSFRVEGRRTYDSRGRIAELSMPFVTQALDLALPVPAGLGTQTFTYDAKGRVNRQPLTHRQRKKFHLRPLYRDRPRDR